MEFQDFKKFVQNSVTIILADLDNLQGIAEAANKSNNYYSTVTTQTTKLSDNFELEDGFDISRCTIPITMVCISVIDMIGQWLKERSDDDFGSYAQLFFKKLSDNDDLKKQAVQEKFKKNFRHGIMHSFFAKAGYGISYPTFDGNSLFTDNYGSTLDAKYLMNIVRQGLNKLLIELQNEESEIAKKAFLGYKKWIE